MRAGSDRGGVFHDLRHFIGIPWPAVNQQLTVWRKCGVEREHLRMCARIDDSPVLAAYLINTIAGDSVELQFSFNQAFARKGFHRVTPNLCNPHNDLGRVWPEPR